MEPSDVRQLSTPGLSGLVLGRGAAVRFSADVIGRLASFLLFVMATRTLDTAGLGTFAYGLALAFVASQLADMGLHTLATREVALRHLRARAFVGTALWLKTALCLPAVTVLVVASAHRAVPVLVSFLCLGAAGLLQTFVDFAGAVFRGDQDLAADARLSAGTRLLAAALGGLGLYLGQGLGGLAASALLSSSIGAAWALRRLHRAGWLGGVPPNVRLTALTTLRQALPLGFANLMSILYTRLAVFLLAALSGEMAVAQFSVAHRLVEPTQLLPAATLAAMFPAYTRALGSSPEGARRLAVWGTLGLALAGTLVAFVLWITAPLLIPFLYGPHLESSVPVLRALGLSVLPAYVNYALTHVLIARDHRLYLSLSVAAMLLLHGGLSWYLIPAGGAIAPAASVLAAETLLTMCCLLKLGRRARKPLRRCAC